MVRFGWRNCTGTKLMASERKKSNSRSPLVAGKRLAAKATTAPRPPRRASQTASASQHFAVCVQNKNYSASLELRKLYPVLEDDFAAQHKMIRVIDESGEDYLYPEAFFVRVELPRAIEQALL